ncbi:mucin-2-like [Cherax quadricarinatus]|uniref:mucin-2-like n=1 Tax=Cherax quadricarinatus TaxID=27406 RepID=UPI002379D7D1|nr:uncharacterized protein LOC128687620 [Cherax quadricarinatus]
MGQVGVLVVTFVGVIWVQGSQGAPWPGHINDGGAQAKDNPPTVGGEGAYSLIDRTIDSYDGTVVAGDEDGFIMSESRSRTMVDRVSASPVEQLKQDSHSKARRLVRQGAGARRRRLMDPERRRQLILRRQKLGLPNLKIRSRQRFTENQVQETPLPVTNTSSTSISTTTSTSRVSSTSSTTSRSAFPSFSAASELRQRYKKLPGGWGMKTNVSDSETTEDESELLETSLSTTGLAERRRGLIKALKRPLPSRLRPTLVRTTTSVPADVLEENKRLRYRPLLADKKSESNVQTTGRTSSHKPEPASLEHNSPVYNSKSQSNDFDESVQNHDSLIYKPQHHLYEPLALQPAFNDEYEPRPYYYETESPLYVQVSKPRSTPMPKKVVLDPLITNTHTGNEPTYNTRNQLHDSLGPVYTPKPTLAAEPVNGPDPAYASDAVHEQNPVYASDPKYTSDSVYDPEVIYAPESAYDSQEDYTSDEDSEEDKPGVLDHYKYGYNVQSKDTGNYHARYEARDGSTVSGSYQVALPDGRVQVVTYVADDEGFRAEVNYEGEENTPTKKSSVDVEVPWEHPKPQVTRQSHANSTYAPARPRPSLPPAHSLPQTTISQPTHAAFAPLTGHNIHFDDLVETASPNPFRLVVERGRASTLAPPPVHTTPTTLPAHSLKSPSTLSAYTLANDVTEELNDTPTTPHPPSTNAHTITPSHTAFQSSTPSHTPVYQYKAKDSIDTTLYSPDAVAYITALGRSHMVPVLLPYTPPPHQARPPPPTPLTHQARPPTPRPHSTITHPQHNILPSPPKTYYLTRRSRAHTLSGERESVEILRGDDRRPRLSLRIPAPHETDIYPAPSPIYHL